MGSGVFLRAAEYIGLYAYATRVDFRNIKGWTLSGGAPA